MCMIINMPSRLVPFAPGEHYHCFNRGVDKRTIFIDKQDYVYFQRLLHSLNTSEVLGKLRLQESREPVDPPVSILSYCLLPNHFHLLLRSNVDSGISKFLQRVAGGYTMYFNNKYQRSGSLFQGKFKSHHIDSDQDLKQVLAYVYRNNLVHDIEDSELFRNSIDTADDLVRGLSSNFLDAESVEIVEIIKEMRSSRKDLEL